MEDDARGEYGYNATVLYNRVIEPWYSSQRLVNIFLSMIMCPMVLDLFIRVVDVTVVRRAAGFPVSLAGCFVVVAVYLLVLTDLRIQ